MLFPLFRKFEDVQLANAPKIFIWQWGRFGSGPRIAFELALALRQYHALDVDLSLSENAEIMSSPTCRDANNLPFATYDTKREFLMRSLLLGRHLKPFLNRLGQNRPDIALSVMPGYWDLIVMNALRRMGVPVVSIVHDATNHPGDRLQLIHIMQNKMIRKSAGLVTLTGFVSRRLANIHGLAETSVRTIAHPPLLFPDLDLEPASPPAYPQRTTLCLLLTGRLRAYKGMALFLQAIGNLDPYRLEVRIAGSIAERDLVQKAQELPNVEIRDGWMSEQSFQENLDWCDVVVLPYTEASQSGIIPTAFARRRPVIATPVGGLPEQVTHEVNGLVTSDVSAAAIGTAIQKFLDTPELVGRYSEAAFQHSINELGWENVSRQYLDYFSHIVLEGQSAG